MESAENWQKIQDYIEKKIDQSTIDQIPNLVEDIVKREEERRFRQLKWIVIFISLVGLGTFGTLANVVIEKAIDAKAGNIREVLELTRINSLATQIGIGKSFSPSEKDEAMSLLMRISKSPDVKKSQDVKNALSSILKSFASAGLDADLDQLYPAFQEEILSNGLSTEIMLHHYGQKIVSRQSHPGSDDIRLKYFEQLENVAAGHELSELALVYRTLYESTIPGGAAKVETLLTRIKDFEIRDAARFLTEITLRTRIENWQNSPTAEGKNFQRISRNFLNKNAKILAAEFNVPADLILEISNKGINAEDARKLSLLIQSRANKEEDEQ